MNARDLLNRYRTPVGIIAVLVIVACVIYVVVDDANSSATDVRDQIYFYSLATHQLEAAPGDAMSPIEQSDGTQAVRAYVYSCSACSSDNLYVMKLETLNEKARATVAAAQGDPARQGELIAAMRFGRMVASPPASPDAPIQWVAAESPQAQRIDQQIAKLCGGEPPYRCEP